METISVTIGIVGGIFAIIFGCATFFRNKKSDNTHCGKKDGYIKSGVDDIKRKQEKQEQQHIEVISRLTAVEASAKQAHKRIDTIEGRHNSNE